MQLPGLIIGLWFTLFSSQSSKEEDLYQYTPDSFRDAPCFHVQVNPGEPDARLLNAVVFHLTNEVRVKYNLKVLDYNILLEKSAMLHSDNMVKHQFFDHIDRKNRNLRNPNDRARAVGIANPYLAENIMETFVLQYKAGEPVYTGSKGVFRLSPDAEPLQAYNYLELGESLLAGWMNSPVHRSNILSPQARELGCGSSFFLNTDFNDMPTVICTQNFQLYEPVRVIE